MAVFIRSIYLGAKPKVYSTVKSVPAWKLLHSDNIFNVELTSFRSTSWFVKADANQLWKGVTSVSNAGRKRGRAKGLMRRRNLNRGQIIGVGKRNMVWPGLNAPILKGKEIVERVELPENKEREEKLIMLRDSMTNRKIRKIDPLDRGWSGHKLPGRTIGPPNPIGEDKFDGFDTKVLELKAVANMSAMFGRIRRMSLFCVTGNKQGLAGYALAKAPDTATAARNARNRAGQRLQYIERCDNHTIYHDFYAQFGRSKVFVHKKPKGHGLVCHRAIKATCEMIGITDLYAKVEGRVNLQNLIKAFFMGLSQQKTHTQLAEEKGLHLVEFRAENNYYPNVVASPKKCRKLQDIPSNEVVDYQEYLSAGRVKLKRKRFPPFFTKLESYEYYLRKRHKYRNFKAVRLTHLTETNGAQQSFLTIREKERATIEAVNE